MRTFKNDFESPVEGSRSKSPFERRPMVKRVLFIRNQVGLVSVYRNVESDWTLVLDLPENKYEQMVLQCTSLIFK